MPVRASGFSHAIARRPGVNAGAGLTTAQLGRPDISLMLAQHDDYLHSLEALGVKLTVLDADEHFPDGCFVEDVAIVTNDCAVITRPGAPSRRGETDAVERLLTAHREIARIEPPGCLDGGDVVIAGDKVFVGLSLRTNEAGAQQLSAILAGHGMHTQTVTVAACLHLKSHVNYLGEDRLIATAAYADRPEFADFSRLVVAAGEEYAANCLTCRNHALVPEGFPQTAEQLALAGFSVVPLDISEFRKMDGGLSCLSIRFDNESAGLSRSEPGENS